jgi:hypothetical protein
LSIVEASFFIRSSRESGVTQQSRLFSSKKEGEDKELHPDLAEPGVKIL